jgi:hypothetical protein
MNDQLARALAAPPAAQPMGNQDMLARVLMGNPDPSVERYPVMEQAGQLVPTMRTGLNDDMWRSARIAEALRNDVNELFAARDPSRNYGTILPISSDPNTEGNTRFDLKGGLTGDLLAMLGAGGRAMRGEEYNPMDITTGMMTAAAPSLASRSSGVLHSAGGRARDGVSRLSNQTLEEVPEMVGREGGVTAETVRRFFEDRNIPYRLQHSGSMSENAGPSMSQYFRVATPDEIQTVRLSDHFYPSSAAVDLRYGQPVASAEQQLADLLKLKTSPQADAERMAIEQARAKFAAEQAQFEAANARMIRENEIIANTPLSERYKVQQELKAQREAEKKAARDARRAARRENPSGEPPQ